MNAPAPQGHDCHKTVLELDLAAYSDIASALEENLDVEAVKTFQDQIQSFVDVGLNELGLRRNDVVFATAGDNALLIFDEPGTMHQFAKIVQEATAKHNSKKSVESAKRWFRMGAATGAVLLIPEERRIVGTTVARAVRLEAAAEKGEILVDMETFEGLPEEFKKLYGPEEVVSGKRDEHFTVRRCAMIPPIKHPETSFRAKAELAANPIGIAKAPASSGGQAWKLVVPLLAVAALAGAAVFYFRTEGLEKKIQSQETAGQPTNQLAMVPPTNPVAKVPTPPAPPPAPITVVPAGPKTLVVPDQYSSIPAALLAAQSGDTVSVKAGVYDGRIIMKSGVKLIGEGRDMVTVRAPATNIVLDLHEVTNAFISNLTLEPAGKLPPDSKARFNVMYLFNSEAVEISDCRVQNGSGIGISVYNSSPKISDCLVRWNGGNGIYVSGAKSRAALIHNDVEENQLAGITFTAGASGTVEQNECARNREDGLVVLGAGTAPDLRANQSHDNHTFGIRFFEGATGVAEKNVCNQNGMSGIQVAGERTSASLTGNLCLSNRAQGIFYSRGAFGAALGNRCNQNTLNGILISDASPTLVSNQCSENVLSGIRFARQGSGKAEENNCWRNKQSGIAVFGDGTPKLHANTCRDNLEYGIWCQQTSQPSLEANKMTGNLRGALTTSGTVNSETHEPN